MKRILATVLGVLMLAGVASAQTYEAALVAKERAAIDSIAASCDSIATLLSAPTPVTFSDPILLWDVTRFSRTGGSSSVVQKGQTLPVIGENITGATSLLCYADWVNLTGQFSIQMLIGPTAAEADTFLTYPIDSSGTSQTQNFWRIDSLTVKQHATEEGFVFRVYNNGHPFLGYLRARVVVDGADDIRGFRLLVIKEY